MNNALINQAATNIRTGNIPAPKAELNAGAANMVNELFQSLQIAYPAWTHTFKTQNELALAKKSWVKTFMECGICTEEQIRLGMKRARADKSDFFPSAGKFVSWCKPTPEELGLPSESDAYREAALNSHNPIGHQWSHPAVYFAGKETGWFFLKSEPQRDTQPAFNRVYEDICKRVMRGDVFVVPAPDATKLEHHKNGEQVMTEESKAAGREAIAAMKARFKVGGGSND